MSELQLQCSWHQDWLGAASSRAKTSLPLPPCRREVDRFREATGKDVGALEAEKAARSHLESRSKAQVCPWQGSLECSCVLSP